MKSWLPLLDRILLKQDEAPMLHPGTGIAMSEQDRIKYRPNTGKVVKVGPGRRHDDGQVYPVAIPEGAHVMFSSTGGTEVEHEGVPHLMMREADVFLVLGNGKQNGKLGHNQFCVVALSPAHIPEISVAIDIYSPQTTCVPADLAAVRMYNGVKGRVEKGEIKSVMNGSSYLVSPIGGATSAELRQALEFHVQNAVPVAILGWDGEPGSLLPLE